MNIDEILSGAISSAVATVAARDPQGQTFPVFHHLSIDPNYSGPHKMRIVSWTIREWKNDKLVATYGTYHEFHDAKEKATQIWDTVKPR